MTDSERQPAKDERTGRSAAAARMQNQTEWVELQLQEARDRGDFDDLPGYGKPLRLGDQHDPDWWLKQLIEREQVTGVLPPALALRKEDAELDGELDDLSGADDVRAAVESFNERVRKALYGNPGGPPLVTRQRDVETEVAAWRERRETRRHDAATEPPAPDTAGPRRRRWFRR